MEGQTPHLCKSRSALILGIYWKTRTAPVGAQMYIKREARAKNCRLGWTYKDSKLQKELRHTQ